MHFVDLKFLRTSRFQFKAIRSPKHVGHIHQWEWLIFSMSHECIIRFLHNYKKILIEGAIAANALRPLEGAPSRGGAL